MRTAGASSVSAALASKSCSSRSGTTERSQMRCLRLAPVVRRVNKRSSAANETFGGDRLRPQRPTEALADRR